MPLLIVPYLFSVSIDVACHGSPSSPVLSGTLGAHEGETSPLDCVSLHVNLGLPLPRLPSTMPSITSRCGELCLMMCPKNDCFLMRKVSGNDLLVPANCNTSSFASSRDILLMAHIYIPYISVD